MFDPDLDRDALEASLRAFLDDVAADDLPALPDPAPEPAMRG